MDPEAQLTEEDLRKILAGTKWTVERFLQLSLVQQGILLFALSRPFFKRQYDMGDRVGRVSLGMLGLGAAELTQGGLIGDISGLIGTGAGTALIIDGIGGAPATKPGAIEVNWGNPPGANSIILDFLFGPGKWAAALQEGTT